MVFIIDPTIGTLTINATNFLTMHPALINELASDALIHMLNSQGRRVGGKRGLSRRAARKNKNRKRRRFVDNIIMHHKRLHDRNRKLVVKNARERALLRKKELEKNNLIKESTTLQHRRAQEESKSKWQDKVNLKKRSLELQSAAKAKRLRAESRWATLMQADKE